MKYKFWKFVHDRLEKAWHWVYYHKLAIPSPASSDRPWLYTYTYFNTKTGAISDTSPLREEAKW